MSDTTTNHMVRTRSGPEGAWMVWFSVSAGLILGLTGLAKVYGAGGDVKLLSIADPIGDTVQAPDAGGGSGRDPHRRSLPVQPDAAFVHGVGGLDFHHLPGLSPWPVVDWVEKAVRLPGQHHRCIGNHAADGGSHRQGLVSLPAHWQLRIADLAVANWEEVES
jgi:hypothetical protein